MIINVHKYNEVCILLFIRYFDIGTRTVVFDDHGDCCSRDQYYQHHLFNRVFDYLLQGKEGTKWVIFDIWTDAIIESNSCLKSWLQLWSLVAAKVGANFFLDMIQEILSWLSLKAAIHLSSQTQFSIHSSI